MLSDISKTKRFKLSLPVWYHDDLLYWAWVKGTDKARLSANILQARIEANRDSVNEQLKEIAEENDITVEDLKQQIRDKYNKNEPPTD